MSNILSRALRPHYDTGASFAKRTAWYFVNLGVVYNPWLPLSLPRVWALRLFGAKVGRGVCIKPHVKVKFPWKLEVGDFVSIGEECWIDNLDAVRIEQGAMLSQRSYLCTGNHDWSQESLPLMTAPITVGEHAWVGAGALLAPGCKVGEGTVITAGSVATGELPPDSVCSGVPARRIKARWRKARRKAPARSSKRTRPRKHKV